MTQIKTKTLNDVCELIVDCEHKTAPTQATGYPSIRTPNIGRGRLILDNVNRVSEETYKAWTKRAIPKADDLILAREAPVGNAAIVPKNLKVCLGQRTVLIRPDKSKLWEPKTLLLTIAANIAETAILTIPACFPDSIVGFVADSKQVTPEFIKFCIDDIKEKMQSFSRGTAQDNLSLDKIKLFDFLVPNKDCIRLFEKYAAPLFSEVQNLLLKNANLRKTRDLILPKLISGEIDLEEIDIGVYNA